MGITSSAPIKSRIAILGAVCLWSTAATVGYKLTAQANAWAIATALESGGLLFFYFLSRTKGNTPISMPIFREIASHPIVLLQVALFSILVTGYYVAFYYSIQTLDPVRANLINYLWPVLFPLFWIVLFRGNAGDKLLYNTFFLALAAIGAWIMIGAAHSMDNPWCLIKYWPAFLAAIAAATYLCVVQSRACLTTEVFYFYGLSLGLVWICLLLLFGPVRLDVSLKAIPGLLYLSLFVFGAAQYLLNYALANGNKVSISAAVYGVPLVSTALLVVFGGVAMTETAWIGGGLIVGSRIFLDATVYCRRSS